MVSIAEKLKQKNFRSAGQEAFLSLLTAAAHLKELFGVLCSKENISIQQYNILRILKGAFPEGYPRCDITERMIEKAPDTTRLIDRLVKQQLAVREKCMEDKRQSITKITTTGLELLEKLDKEVRSFESSFEKSIGKDTCRTYVAINEKILNF